MDVVRLHRNSVPSLYFESRTAARLAAWRDAAREWWDDHRHRYRLFTSRFVLEELSRAPSRKSRASLAMMRSVTVLDEPSGLPDVVRFYLDHHLMPAEAGGDAFHFGMASMCSMSFLLTWNCRHLANSNKVQHMSVLNGRLGLSVPLVTTPLTLIPESFA
jgi:hypothetical protein